jgi:flagellar basal body-associated protein FliL
MKTTAHASGRGAINPKLLMIGGVILVAAGLGYGAAIMTGSGPASAAAAEPTGAASASSTEGTEKAPPSEGASHSASAEKKDPKAKADKGEFTYYDFEPIVVNLDEPRLARYVRVTLTLAVLGENHDTVTALIEKKKPELKNWVTTYFSSCTLDQVRGAANLNRLRREILDAFNQQLWPDQKPLISHVLFKEFAVS